MDTCNTNFAFSLLYMGEWWVPHRNLVLGVLCSDSERLQFSSKHCICILLLVLFHQSSLMDHDNEWSSSNSSSDSGSSLCRTIEQIFGFILWSSRVSATEREVLCLLFFNFFPPLPFCESPTSWVTRQWGTCTGEWTCAVRVRQFPDAPNRNMERVVVEMPINNGEIKCHLHVERAFQTRLKKAPKNRSWCFFSLSAHGRCCSSSSSSDALGSALESCLARVCAGLSACVSSLLL